MRGPGPSPIATQRQTAQDEGSAPRPLLRDNDEERLTRLELLLDQLRQQDDARADRIEEQIKNLRDERIRIRGREPVQRRAS